MNATTFPKRGAIFCFLAAATMLTGCTYNRPKGPMFSTPATPSPYKAVIYFYRPPDESAGSGNITYYLTANGRKLTDILCGGYYLYEVDPGHLLLLSDNNQRRAKVDPVSAFIGGGMLGVMLGVAINSQEVPPPATLEFEVEPGRIYYVKFHPEVQAVDCKPQLFLMANGVGESEIKGCKLIQN
jgi:hypothetical protein